MLAQLAGSRPAEIRLDDALHGAREAANAGAIAIGSMFSAVVSGKPVDVRGAKDAAAGIADSIAEDGLSNWLETVRLHHEGTYQHCLLVAGVATDFGLNSVWAAGTWSDCIRRRFFTTSAKRGFLLAILDKPGQLDAEERARIETHPAAGWGGR